MDKRLDSAVLEAVFRTNDRPFRDSRADRSHNALNENSKGYLKATKSQQNEKTDDVKSF